MRWLAAVLGITGACAKGVITTVAGTDYIFPDDGKPALQAHLLWFAGPGLNMILRLDTRGTVAIVAGNGLARYAGDGGPARAASLSTPWGLAIDASCNLYCADSNNGVVRRTDTSGVITTVAGGGSLNPGDGSKATQVSLNQPVAVAFDPAGNGQLAFAGDGGPAINASLQAGEGLAVAPDGTIYVAEANNGAVRKIAPNGIITTLAGRGPAPEAAAGPATGVSLRQPTAVALDIQGNLLGMQ